MLELGLEKEAIMNKKLTNIGEGIGGAFLIGQQDYGTIKVTDCKQIPSKSEPPYLFYTVISDTVYHLDHKREILVVSTNQGFKIDDVRNVK